MDWEQRHTAMMSRFATVHTYAELQTAIGIPTYLDLQDVSRWELKLTEAGSSRETVRVTLGRLSMAQKRTNCAEEKRPISTACRKMSGRALTVTIHSESTASMANLSNCTNTRQRYIIRQIF